MDSMDWEDAPPDTTWKERMQDDENMDPVIKKATSRILRDLVTAKLAMMDDGLTVEAQEVLIDQMWDNMRVLMPLRCCGNPQCRSGDNRLMVILHMLNGKAMKKAQEIRKVPDHL